MRTMLRVSMEVEAANKAFQTGELQKIMSTLSEKLKPDAVYFSLYQGERTAYFIFDMTESSNMPYFFEPLFEKLKAKIELTPVMTQEDLEKGFKKLMAQ